MRVKNTVDFKAVERKMKAAIGLYGDTASKKMEAHAKKNKIWTDRTSNAKNSIQGDFGWKGNSAMITLSGNTDYFVYLELAYAKKYAILKPTINQFSAEVLSGYKKVVGR